MNRIFLILVFLLAFHHDLFPIKKVALPQNNEYKKVANDKMEWWREARFGMFIHWGVYSVYGNIYEGIDVEGNEVSYNKVSTGLPSEWILPGAKIPRSVYRDAAKQFDAKDYDPKAWVQMAKYAGMKYIVITAKHHDGFCLFDTKYTDWNAVQSSAAQKDLLKDLVKEAKIAGLKIGFYYSQNLDWMHEGGMGSIPELHGAEYSNEQIEKYVDNLVIPHIKELTDNYDIDIVWFDIPYANSNQGRANRILQALLKSRLGDKIIFNDRLGGSIAGDYVTRETAIPDVPYNGYEEDIDWEACASMNSSWGYENSKPDSWATPLYILSHILELSSKGGNFLLNVGPDKHGNIPSQAQNILKEVGDWMAKYSESIYGTVKNELLNPFEYGYITQKNNTDKSQDWYLHISTSYWSNLTTCEVNGVMEAPISAYMVGSNEPVKVELTEKGLLLHLPKTSSDPYYSVVKLIFKKKPIQIYVSSINKNQEINLTPYQAVLSNGIDKNLAPYVIKYWYSASSIAKWNIYLNPGTYNLSGELSAWNDGEIYFKIGENSYSGNYFKTENMDTYVISDFTKVTINKAGLYTLEVTRKVDDSIFNIINLRRLTLKLVGDSGIIPNVIQPSFTIYPNPAKDYFVIETKEPQIIDILNLTGRSVMNAAVEKKSIVDVSSIRPGTYIVRGKNSAQKLIIK